MPSPAARPGAAPTTRRAALLVGSAAMAGAALAACTSGPRPPSPSRTGPDPDVSARRAAAERERGLTATAVAVAGHSTGAAGLRARAAAAAHQAHVVALLDGLPEASTAVSTGPSATAAAPSSSGGGATPTVRGLARGETEAAAAYQALLLGVGDELARLLASVAASDLAHAARLRAAAT